MIHYQLQCADGHDFEGWFRDSAAFEDQARRGLLSCPQCGGIEVGRGLMAPSVRSSRNRSRDVEPAPDGSHAAMLPDERGGLPDERRGQPDEPRGLPDEVRAALQRLRAEVERHCDDVGDGFAEAARRLHGTKAHPENPRRGIYGQVSEPEREALSEEGIEITRIPWLPRAES